MNVCLLNLQGINFTFNVLYSNFTWERFVEIKNSVQNSLWKKELKSPGILLTAIYAVRFIYHFPHTSVHKQELTAKSVSPEGSMELLETTKPLE